MPFEQSRHVREEFPKCTEQFHEWEPANKDETVSLTALMQDHTYATFLVTCSHCKLTALGYFRLCWVEQLPSDGPIATDPIDSDVVVEPEHFSEQEKQDLSESEQPPITPTLSNPLIEALLKNAKKGETDEPENQTA